MKNNRLDETKVGDAKVIVDILPKGKCVPDVKMSKITHITIHNTGGMASAKNNHTYMKNINKSGERIASWHFTVDSTEIYQAQSTNYKMFHAGNANGNNYSIGIEICQSNDKTTQEKIYRNAIELVKILMKYHDLSIDKVVKHQYWSGKACPDYLIRGVHGFNWDWFVNECKNITANKKTETWYRAVCGSFKDKAKAEERIKDLTSKGYSGCFIVAFEKEV